MTFAQTNPSMRAMHYRTGNTGSSYGSMHKISDTGDLDRLFPNERHVDEPSTSTATIVRERKNRCKQLNSIEGRRL